MKCKHAKRYLPDFLRNDLPPDLAANVKDHLDACPECRDESEKWRIYFRTMRSCGGAAVPGGLAAKLKGIYPGKRTRPYSGRLPAFLLSAAVLFAAVAVFTHLPSMLLRGYEAAYILPAETRGKGPQADIPGRFMEAVTFAGGVIVKNYSERDVVVRIPRDSLNGFLDYLAVSRNGKPDFPGRLLFGKSIFIRISIR